MARPRAAAGSGRRLPPEPALAAAVRSRPSSREGGRPPPSPSRSSSPRAPGSPCRGRRVGLALRAAGAPRAARAIGLDDAALRGGAFLVSGALAGLAGGLEVVAVTGRLYDPFSAGVGYSGIAAALLGGTPPGATALALLLAALGAGSGAMQRDTGVPSAIAALVPGLLVLAVLLARRRLGPEHA